MNIRDPKKAQAVSPRTGKAKMARRKDLLTQLFSDNNAMSALQRFLRILSDPCKLGARFCWGYAEAIYDEECASLGIERRLWIQWVDEEPHPMTDADQTQLVSRLHALGFTFVNERYIWELLWSTLPHDGNGRNVRR